MHRGRNLYIYRKLTHFKIFYIALLPFIFTHYLIEDNVNADTTLLEDNSHIATIGKKTISYREIRTTLNSTRLYLQTVKGHAPRGEDDAELERIKYNRELQKLADEISKAVIQGMVNDLRLSASQEEIQIYLNEFFLNSQIDTTDTALKIRAITKLILDVLKKVENGEEDSDTAYKKFLANKITPQEWSVYQDNFKDPKRRKLLESRGNVTAAQLDKALETNARSIIQAEKLAEWVDNEIEKNDSKFKKYLIELDAFIKKNQSANDVDMDSTELQEMRLYIASARTTWWAEYYKKNVIINHPLFIQVFELLRNPINYEVVLITESHQQPK